MWLQPTTRRSTSRCSASRCSTGRCSIGRCSTGRRAALPHLSANLATVLLCIAALSFCTGPAVASVFVRLAGSLSEELPTETHSWSETQPRTGVRLRIGSSNGDRTPAAGLRRVDLADHVSAVGPRVVNSRRLSDISGFLPSTATAMIRAGIQLRC